VNKSAWVAEHVRWILGAKQRYDSAICCNKAARPPMSVFAKQLLVIGQR
jgi:hypothetical protein